MRVVIQRVKRASVKIGQQIFSEIGPGLLVFVGIEDEDRREDVDWLCGKIVQLRIFDDQNGVMNLSIIETGGEILAVSQFTLHAKTKKGNRPSYIKAANSAVAIPLYNQFTDCLSQLLGKKVKTGEFGAMMEVSLVNDGPVTILIDSKNRE
jgi:D-aminoacyl-tRNA deacylase